MPLTPQQEYFQDATDNAGRFGVPSWYGKASRATKSQYWNTEIGKGLNAYGEAAYAGRDEEERRGAAQEAYYREEKAKADKPTITQQEIDRQFGRKSDAASDNYADAMTGLRDYIGESGVSGGMVDGLAVNAELARLRTLTTARGDLMSFKATQDALDRDRAFRRAEVVGQSIARPISMLGIDFENQALQTQQGLLGLETNRAGAKEMANATKDAATKGMIGSIGGGLLGFL